MLSDAIWPLISYHPVRPTKRPREVAGAVKQSMLDNFNATVAKNLLIMKYFNVFAIIIACGVVYNGRWRDRPG